MIYHEVAVEPTALEDLKDLGLLQRMFGFEHGRLVAFVPAKGKGSGADSSDLNWRTLVFRHLKTLFPSKEKEIELQLMKVFESCVWRSRGGSKYGPGESWRTLAMREHEAKQFAAIMCAEPGLCCHPEYSYQGLYSPPAGFPDFLREPIHVSDSFKSPDEFLKNLHPLIMSAKRVTLIDPYFNPLPEDDGKQSIWLNTLRRLAAYLGDANRRTIDINIHTKSPEFDAKLIESRVNIQPLEFVTRSLDLLVGYFPKETTISISSWSKRYQGQKFHARYLITDRAGAAFEYGTDMRPGQRTDVSLMPLAMAKERLAEFDCLNPTIYALDANLVTKGVR